MTNVLPVLIMVTNFYFGNDQVERRLTESERLVEAGYHRAAIEASVMATRILNERIKLVADLNGVKFLPKEEGQ